MDAASSEGQVIAPDERLPLPAMFGIGAQHVLAMFGATAIVPVLTGFPVSTTLLFAGIGTLLFVLITRQPRADLHGLELRLHRARHRREADGGDGRGAGRDRGRGHRAAR